MIDYGMKMTFGEMNDFPKDFCRASPFWFGEYQ